MEVDELEDKKKMVNTVNLIREWKMERSKKSKSKAKK